VFLFIRQDKVNDYFRNVLNVVVDLTNFYNVCFYTDNSAPYGKKSVRVYPSGVVIIQVYTDTASKDYRLEWFWTDLSWMLSCFGYLPILPVCLRGECRSE